MQARMLVGRRAAVATALLVASLPAALAQVATTIAITERDRTAHVVGERVGVEVVLDVGAWPADPPPTGIVRIGDASRPDADCTITLPAEPPLGCLWGADVAGTYSLVATYSGGGPYAPSVSPAVVHTVLPPGLPERVSIPDPASADRDAGGPSRFAATSADGRWIVYVSREPRLTDDPRATLFEHALLFDRRSGRTRRVSNAADGTPANRDVEQVAISGDGRRIAFLTAATNLEAGDPPGTRDWFVADRDSGAVQRLPALRVGSVTSAVGERIALSHDGRFIAFDSERSDLVGGDANGVPDVFRLDRDSGVVALASVGIGGSAANALSSSPSISGDGRLVAFASAASDLVPGDGNGNTDVFVRDFAAATTERASISAVGTPVAAFAVAPALSADGRYVAFSGGDGFVTGDNDGRPDIFVRDRQAGTTTWTSPDPPAGALRGVSSPSISADGTRVAFRGFEARDLYLFDAQAGTVSRVGAGGFANPLAFPSQSLQLSADGRSVVYDSAMLLLVAGDGNRAADVFVEDASGTLRQRVSAIRLTGAASGNGSGPAALSDDGSVVAFLSAAGNLVPDDANGGPDAFVRDRLASRTQLASRMAAGGSASRPTSLAPPGISGDGRYVVFSSPDPFLAALDGADGNDVFLHDRQDGSVRMLSRTLGGLGSQSSTSPAISRDGRWVAFVSDSSQLTNPPASGFLNVFLHDVAGASTIAVPADGGGLSNALSTDPRVSGDGRLLVFTSSSSTLVADDTNGVVDIFLFDRVANTVRRLSVDAAGVQSNGASRLPEISTDGSSVAFVSDASNLVPNDTNSASDVFVVSIAGGTIERASVGPGSVQATGGDSGLSRPGLSGDGRFVVFDSLASGLLPGGPAGFDAYVFDRRSRDVRRVLMPPAGFEAARAGGPSISADGRSIAFLTTSALPGSARHAHDYYVTDNPIAADQCFVDGFEGD